MIKTKLYNTWKWIGSQPVGFILAQKNIIFKGNASVVNGKLNFNLLYP